VNITLGAAFLSGGILLFWCTMIGTRLVRPPRWTSDTMVMCVIAPACIFLVVAGGAMFFYTALHRGWSGMTLADLSGLGIVLGVAVALGFLLAGWSRRAPRAVAADVIPMTRPESPEPPRPAPQLGTPRKAA